MVVHSTAVNSSQFLSKNALLTALQIKKSSNGSCMCQNNQSHSHPSSLLPIAPRTAAVLPVCTTTKILCRRNSRLRGSPVALQRRLPRSLVKSTAASPNTPAVSTTKGTKWWLVSRCAYLPLSIAPPVQPQRQPLQIGIIF